MTEPNADEGSNVADRTETNQPDQGGQETDGTTKAITIDIDSTVAKNPETDLQIKTERLNAFDAFRGLCIMGMIIDHVRSPLFSDPDGEAAVEGFRNTPDYHTLYNGDVATTVYRWILRAWFPFGAPGFAMLMGFGLCFLFENRITKVKWSTKYTIFRIVIRGFLLCLFVFAGILFMLGVNMMLSIPFLYIEHKYYQTHLTKCKKYKFFTPVNVLILSVIILNFILTQLFVSLYHHQIIFSDDSVKGFAFYIVGIFYLPILQYPIIYPLMPWFNFILIGILLARYFKIKKKLDELDEAYKTMLIHALVYFALFVLIRSIGNNDFGNFEAKKWYDFRWAVFQYLILTKYPPSLTFALLALSQCFILLNIIRVFEKKFVCSVDESKDENRNKCVRFMTFVYDIALTFGRVPFVVYFFHLVIGLVLVIFVRRVIGDVFEYYAWYSNVLIVGISIMMYCMLLPCAKKYRQFKFNKTAKSCWKFC